VSSGPSDDWRIDKRKGRENKSQQTTKEKKGKGTKEERIQKEEMGKGFTI